jgi:hypothetical protein
VCPCGSDRARAGDTEDPPTALIRRYLRCWSARQQVIRRRAIGMFGFGGTLGVQDPGEKLLFSTAPPQPAGSNQQVTGSVHHAVLIEKPPWVVVPRS